MGYKLKRIMMRPNGVEKRVRPKAQHFVFDFKTSAADWTIGDRLSWVSGTGIVRATSGSETWREWGYYNNDLNIDWDNVKKLTLTTVFGGNTGNWYGSTVVSIVQDKKVDGYSSGTPSCYISSQYSSGRTGNYGYWDTAVLSNLSILTREEDIAIYDFENLKTSFYRNGTQLADNVNIDAGKVTSLRAANNQVLNILLDAAYYKYIESIDLLVEY